LEVISVIKRIDTKKVSPSIRICRISPVGRILRARCPNHFRDGGARLCAKHQPQHIEKLRGITHISAGCICEAAAAGLRHIRAPRAVRGCASYRPGERFVIHIAG
jgi:hypothetical protein